jgi:L-ornithine Nalpha-acyltransferase
MVAGRSQDFPRIYPLLYPETRCKMRRSEIETNMRVEGLADPELISAEACKRRGVDWTPEWLTQHFVTGWLRKSKQQSEPSKRGAIGQLEVSLTQDKRDVRLLQELRYKVFYQQGQAVADIATWFMRRDTDYFDGICDHLMVVDRSRQDSPTNGSSVVGTYRLLRQEVAEQHGGFYSAKEFDISGLLKRHASLRFLELGRSCVLPTYRSKRAIELLWHGVWSYVREHRIDVMIGCASFEGTDIEQLARPLSFLHHFARAPEPWRSAAHSVRQVEMNRMAKNEIDVRASWHKLPPLIKGYLRLGAFVGDGAVIDPHFGTTDVLIILPVAAINARYISHFGVDAQRYAVASERFVSAAPHHA